MYDSITLLTSQKTKSTEWAEQEMVEGGFAEMSVLANGSPAE
jgi:hypothetical protein